MTRLVLAEAERRLQRSLGPADLADDAVRAVAAGITVACATDGNHGRSVAWGAARAGCRCVIFVHAGVSAARAAAIAALGAEVVRVEGAYDDSVVHAARACETQSWLLVSDTSWPGYERTPGLVMQGYTVLVAEALAVLIRPPTHVFVQAGVGGLAAAVAARLETMFGQARPCLVVVEPERAACLFESVRQGCSSRIPQQEPTVMAMLECYEPSLVAWRILTRCADAFMTIPDEAAVEVMNRLARPGGGDPPIVAGESGGAGLAGLIQVCRDDRAREALRLDDAARVLVINSEGATDRQRYLELVGLAPEAVCELGEPR